MLFFKFTAVLLALVNVNCVPVTHNGMITKLAEEECTFDNGITRVSSPAGITKIDGMWYGLIEYNCSNSNGKMISIPECVTCGLYCVQNTMIPGCKQNDVLSIIAIILSTVVFIIVLLLSYDKLYLFVKRIINYMLYKKHKSRIIKIKNNAVKLSKMAQVPIRVSAEQTNKRQKHYGKKYNAKIDTLNLPSTYISGQDIFKPTQIVRPKSTAPPTTFIELHEQVRFEIEEGHQATEQDRESKGKAKYESQATTSQVAIESASFINDNPIKSESKKEEPMFNFKEQISIPFALNTPIITTIIILHLALFAVACDSNLYFTSTGRVCRGDKCSDISASTFQIKTGQTLCFFDVNGNQMNIKIAETLVRTKYVGQYQTSDYKLRVNSVPRCKGAGSCWDNQCGINTYGDTELGTTDDDKYPTGYECEEHSAGCDGSCWSNKVCEYMKWQVIPTGPKYTVYRNVVTFWEATLIFSYNGTEVIRRLTTNEPDSNLLNIGQSAISQLPIIITNVMSPVYHHPDYLLADFGYGHSLEASPMNHPSCSQVGDLQIPLKTGSTIFSSNCVRCRASMCKGECKVTQSQLRRFLDHQNNTKTPRTNIYETGSNQIETRHKVSASISMMLGDFNIHYLNIKKAHCMIDTVTAYSCFDCPKLQYVIMKSKLIKQEGIMEIETNCSISRKFLSCNTEPYIMEFEEINNQCWIYVPETNQTIEINVQIDYTGILDPIRNAQLDLSSYGAVKSIITDTDFITSVTKTLMSYTLISIGVTTVIRIVRLMMINKAALETNNKA